MTTECVSPHSFALAWKRSLFPSAILTDEEILGQSGPEHCHPNHFIEANVNKTRTSHNLLHIKTCASFAIFEILNFDVF